MRQPKLPVPPTTEADYLAARAAIIASMKPERQAAVLAYYANPDEKFQKAIK